MIRKLLFLGALALSSVSASAQENAASESPPAGVEQLRHVIGEWQVRTDFLSPDGSVRASVHGTYSFEWVEPDRIVKGMSKLDGLGASGLLFYVRGDEIEMISVGQDGKVWIMTGPIDGETRETPVVTMDDGSSMKLRFTRSAIEKDRFESRMTVSTDGGDTWLPGNFQLFERCSDLGCASASAALVWNRYNDGEWAIMGFDAAGRVARLSPTGENHWVWGRRGDRLLAHGMRETPEGKQRWHAQTLAIDGMASEAMALGQSDDGQWDCHPTDGYCLLVEPKGGHDRIIRRNDEGSVVAFLEGADHGYSDPQFSNDGTKLVYRSDREGSWEVYVANPDGSDAKRLTDDAANDDVERHWYGGEGPPVFSPDGESIYWTRRFPTGGFDVWSMRADGSDKRNLTATNDGSDSYPRPSPDGRLIAFNSDRDGNDEIYVMNVDGSNVRRVTRHPATDLAPVWLDK